MGEYRRTAPRIVVILSAVTVLIATMLVPAYATSGEEDLEALRSEVAGTFTYKINKLTERKAQTTNPGRIDAYEAGIAELTSARDQQVPAATTAEELWALDELAHAIYRDTKAAVEAVPPTPEEALAEAKEAAASTITSKIKKLQQWIAGCDDPEAIAIVDAGIAQLEALYPLVEAAGSPDDAYAVKQRAKELYSETKNAAEAVKDDPKDETPPVDEPKEKTPAEKAAEELARARRSTIALLEDKAAILRTAAEAELIAAVVKVFENAAADIEALVADAKAAPDKERLSEIEDQARTIYQAAKEAAMAIRNSEEGDPAEALAAYLDRIINYVTTTTQAAEPSADESPDTFADLVEARDLVLNRVARVAEVAESGDDLAERWEDLNDSLSGYRLALIRHYIALGEPLTIGGVQIPG